MKICYETVRNSEEIRTYITQADQSLLARGFTEHSFAHVTRCAEFAARILAQLGYGAVSYTHLDVYKRQVLSTPPAFILSQDQTLNKMVSKERLRSSNHLIEA